MSSISFQNLKESSLEVSTIDSSVTRERDLQDKKDILTNMNNGSFTKADIKKLKKHVIDWYPFYEDFGKKKVYPESSIFWRILTYIPYLKNISGFETFEKLGKDAAKKDIDNLTKFLKEDIPKKINELNEQITACKISTENKRNSL